MAQSTRERFKTLARKRNRSQSSMGKGSKCGSMVQDMRGNLEMGGALGMEYFTTPMGTFTKASLKTIRRMALGYTNISMDPSIGGSGKMI